MPVPPIADNLPFPHHGLGNPSTLWTYRDAASQVLFHVARFDEPGGKKQILPMTCWRLAGDKLVWRWRALPEPRPLYGLDRLAKEPAAPVLVCEGEKAADAAVALFPDWAAITSANGAKAADKADWSPLAGRRVVIWPDNDDDGRDYAADVAHLANQAGAASVAIVTIPNGFPSKWDLADPPPNGFNTEGLRSLLAEAKPFNAGKKPTAIDEDAEILRLARLSPLAYARERSAAATLLGVGVSLLDKAVKAAAKAKLSSGLSLPTPEPWPEPVDGAELLTDITTAIRRYVVMEDGDAEAVALWVLHAHALDAFGISPRLAITSPEMGCGKTTLLDVLGCLVPRPLPTANVTAPAVFRTVETCSPTILLDEADTFIKGNEELRGILNSGHRKSTAFVMRLVGEDHEPKMFKTWCRQSLP